MNIEEPHEFTTYDVYPIDISVVVFYKVTAKAGISVVQISNDRILRSIVYANKVISSYLRGV